MADTLDFLNRDPNNINDHIKVAFEDVIAEPDGSHSAVCLWKCAECCFRCSKGCCYNIMAVICGIPIAMCWGCGFAGIAFSHVWTITPLLRCCTINCGCMQKFISMCFKCYLAPYCETVGLCLSNIVVRKI